MPQRLPPQRPMQRLNQRPILQRIAPEQPTQVQRILLPQTQQQPPLHRHSHPIATATKILRIRRNKPDPRPRMPRQPHIPGRPTAVFGAVEQHMLTGNHPTHVITGTERLPPRTPHIPQGHFLDKTDIDPLLDRIPHQPRHLIEIAPFHHHAIELDPLEPRIPRRLDTVQYLAQVTVAGDRPKPLGVQAVEADVHALDPCVHQGPRQSRQLRAVACHHQFTQARQRRDVATQPDNPRPDQRLTAGQADLAHALAHEQPGQALEFFQAQHLLARQEGHGLRHAVHTAKITAVGHRQAQVVDGTAEPIHQAHVTAPTASRRPAAQGHECPPRRSGFAGTAPTPSATRLVAAGCESPRPRLHKATAALRYAGRC
ncbi:hypothetical protein ALQ17_05326 [Pseudomonas fluorescens]|nr:hypothetical protein ALQ17_05326 [Pseudomonas fluorescens]